MGRSTGTDLVRQCAPAAAAGPLFSPPGCPGGSLPRAPRTPLFGLSAGRTERPARRWVGLRYLGLQARPVHRQLVHVKKI